MRTAPSAAVEKLVFEQTMEGMFVRGVGSRMSPKCRARLKAAGLDLDKKLLPAYPFDVWMTCLQIATEELFPSIPNGEAHFKLGQLLIDGYKETFLGRAVLGMVRVLGPRRTLVRSSQNFRSGNNYTDTRLVEVSETCMELWMNEVGPYPTFTAGILHAAVSASGAEAVKVDVLNHDGHAATYRLGWGGNGSTGVGGKGDSNASTKSGSISSR